VTTLSKLADALAEAAGELEQSNVQFDHWWAVHLRNDATGIRLLLLADRHQRPTKVTQATTACPMGTHEHFGSWTHTVMDRPELVLEDGPAEVAGRL
jgi:hypothetical protein